MKNLRIKTIVASLLVSALCPVSQSMEQLEGNNNIQQRNLNSVALNSMQNIRPFEELKHYAVPYIPQKPIQPTKIYSNLDEMPPDARRAVEEANRNEFISRQFILPNDNNTPALGGQTPTSTVQSPGKPESLPSDADGVEYSEKLKRWIPYKLNKVIIDCNAAKIYQESKGYLHHYYYNSSTKEWTWQSEPMKAANNIHGPEFDDTQNPFDHSYDDRIAKKDNKSYGQYDAEHKGNS